MKAIKKVRDNIHLVLTKIFSYNKPFMAIIGPREIGKSTTFWLWHFDNWVNDLMPAICFRRNTADISEFYIESIAEIIRKFSGEIGFIYSKDAIKKGAVMVYALYKGEKHLFMCILSCSVPIGRLKSLVVRNPRCGVFDEFIIDTSTGEKYLPNEAKKVKEIINTFQRECDGVFRVFFLGNPYSLYNPIFAWWGVPTSKLKAGAIITGNNWVVQCATISPELKEYILKHNPLYDFEEDDEYKRYAFNGEAVNDKNILIQEKPDAGMQLIFVFKIEGKNLLVYIGGDDYGTKFWVGFNKAWNGNRRNIYVFEFRDLVNNGILIGREERMTLSILKAAIRTRNVYYGDLEAAYMIQDIFPLI